MAFQRSFTRCRKQVPHAEVLVTSDITSVRSCSGYSSVCAQHGQMLCRLVQGYWVWLPEGAWGWGGGVGGGTSSRCRGFVQLHLQFLLLQLPGTEAGRHNSCINPPRRAPGPPPPPFLDPSPLPCPVMFHGWSSTLHNFCIMHKPYNLKPSTYLTHLTQATDVRMTGLVTGTDTSWSVKPKSSQCLLTTSTCLNLLATLSQSP